MTTVNQIYSIVNALNAQAFGSSAISVIDNQGLVTLGNDVLSSSTNKDLFLNTLVQRIGKVIISYRAYRSNFDEMVLSDFEYGAILQKLKINVPQAVADEAYNLENGQSVDMFTVNKPTVQQKLFITESPWNVYITIQDVLLKEAFKGAVEMGSFISAIYGEVQNVIETSLENLARNCMVNYIAEIIDQKNTRAYNLLELYNADTGETLTTTTCKYSTEFAQYCVRKIKTLRQMMTSFASIYNDGTTTRHTPKDLQMTYIQTEWNNILEQQGTYGQFFKDWSELPNFKLVNYWQSIQSPSSINVNRASDGTAVSQSEIIAFVCDKDALGIAKKELESNVTPFNARGRFYNIFWNAKDMYINDLSENAIVFYVA